MTSVTFNPESLPSLIPGALRVAIRSNSLILPSQRVHARKVLLEDARSRLSGAQFVTSVRQGNFTIVQVSLNGKIFTGVAKRNGIDVDNPLVGMRLAATRALALAFNGG